MTGTVAVCEDCAKKCAVDPSMTGFIYWYAECSICTRKTFVMDAALLGGIDEPS